MRWAVTYGPNDGGRDVERAVAELAARLPEPLVPLARLAYNYRWTWAPDGPAIFADVDRRLWTVCQANPRWLIEASAPRRRRELAADEHYVARLGTLAAALDGDLARPAAPGPIPSDRPV